MPFQSKAQMRYLYAKHPEVAKEFASKTESTDDLPEHKHKNKKWSPWMELAKGGSQDKKNR